MELDQLMPAFNFLQYKEGLISRGICYGRSIVDFDTAYYVENVGMTDGAAAEFLQSAQRILRKQNKAKVVADKENHPVHKKPSFEV
jgi:hypothetical protein